MQIYSKKDNCFKSLLWENGFTDLSGNGQKDIAKYFERSPRTIRYWIKTNKVPKWATEKLSKKSMELSGKWKDFNFMNNKLLLIVV